MGSFQHFGDCLTLPGAADLSLSRGLAVKINATGQWAIASLGGIGDRVHGILTEGFAPVGQGATAQLRGVAECVAGGAVAPGDYVKATAAGKALTTVTANDKIFGVCVEGAAALNDMCAIMLFLGGIAY